MGMRSIILSSVVCPHLQQFSALSHKRYDIHRELYPHAATPPDWLLTYLLTPWSRVLLEKLSGLQLVKKFPAFYGARRFITALTSARHLSLSWASSLQSTHPHPTSRRYILMLSSHLYLGLPRKSAIEDQRTHQRVWLRYHIVAFCSMYECTGVLLEMHKALQ